jgi:putative ATP-dependent endonuclease of OLD family
MKIKRLTISNFRGIVNATLYFDGHTLLIGGNNVGKSTIFEALDLVLGPDRLNRFPPIDEVDFYNSKYRSEDGKGLISIRIEVILTDLSDELLSKVSGFIEHWYAKEKRLLGAGEVDLVDDPATQVCLRLETVGKYDGEDDDFTAQTYFSHSPNEAEGELKGVSKKIKQSFGFLYLRTLRTASRALTLERGSLLEIILRLGGIRTGLWEESIERLRTLSPPIGEGAPNLKTVLESIEERVGQYIHLNGKDSSTSLFVSNLSREHLRKTISFFLSITPDQSPVPFQEVGTGTLNTIVLALLTFIAEIKKDDVIFAMEEPEIALPPHTQRRIANYLLDKTSQCFVTSHSPYIIEVFDPGQVQILRRSITGVLSGISVSPVDSIKAKTYRKHARRGVCEAMLGHGVILVEGITEQAVLWAMARKMEDDNSEIYPIDLSGVTIFSNDGDGLMPDFGNFFRQLGLKTYGLLDHKKVRPPNFTEKLPDAFDYHFQTIHVGIEALLSAEIPIEKQWTLLNDIRNEDEKWHPLIPMAKPAEDSVIANLTIKVLKGSKGDGTAGRLIESCTGAELPKTLTDFMSKIYQDFPRPAKIKPVDFSVPQPNTSNGEQK